MMEQSKTKKESAKQVDLLNQALRLEYSLIVNYPRIANAIRDDKMRQMALTLASDSIHHADTVASAIRKLGGIPDWSLEPFPLEIELIEMFKKQLEKEKMALKLHQQSMNLFKGNSLRAKFSKLAEEEKNHIKLIGIIISRWRNML